MPVKTHGFDELSKALKRVEKTITELGGEHQVPFDELFCPAFMRKHTRFDSFAAMIQASGYTVNSAEDFKAIPDADWEALVKAKTDFPSWEEMQGKATEEWAGDKIARAWGGKG